MYNYHVVSVWKVKTYQEVAWRTISDQAKWIRWWPDIKKVTVLDNGNSDGTGKKYHHIWKGFLLSNFACNLQVTTLGEQPYSMEATASGDLEGKMRWEVKGDGDTAILTCTADLRITKPWMSRWENYLSPLFKRSYEAMMRRGAKALSNRLETKLVQCKNSIHAQPFQHINLHAALLQQ